MSPTLEENVIRRPWPVGLAALVLSLSSVGTRARASDMVPVRCEVSLDGGELIVEVVNLADRDGQLWDLPHFLLVAKNKSAGRAQRLSAVMDPERAGTLTGRVEWRL